MYSQTLMMKWYTSSTRHKVSGSLPIIYSQQGVKQSILSVCQHKYRLISISLHLSDLQVQWICRNCQTCSIYWPSHLLGLFCEGAFKNNNYWLLQWRIQDYLKVVFVIRLRAKRVQIFRSRAHFWVNPVHFDRFERNSGYQPDRSDFEQLLC